MPISKSHSDAARANGARSKGPVTPEGKARSSQNARRHGLLASDCTLRMEDPEAFQQLEQAYIDEWQPQGETENGLVQEMILCRYRQSRLVSVEVSAWNLRMDLDLPDIRERYPSMPDEKERRAIAFHRIANESRTFDVSNRYEARFHRQYMRALAQLEALQDRRRGSVDPE
jgi:hypothetical protein